MRSGAHSRARSPVVHAAGAAGWARGAPGAWANDPDARQVQQMYIAYYGRPGDPAGVGHWAGRLAEVGGNWIADLVNPFGTSVEYTERFGSLTDATLIDNLYRQLFNRSAEPVGLGYYVDLLADINHSGPDSLDPPVAASASALKAMRSTFISCAADSDFVFLPSLPPPLCVAGRCWLARSLLVGRRTSRSDLGSRFS